MTMREKMARAMYERVCRTNPKLPSVVAGIHAWDDDMPGARADWLAAADAALDALLEPTLDMIGDVADEVGMFSRPLWQAMIIAAKDGK